MSFYNSIQDSGQTGLFQQYFAGVSGFEELKKHLKHGNDFCKEIAFIIQERAELESTYSKGLSKLAARLVRVSQNNIGTITEGWKAVSTSMEVEADLHKNLGNSLLEDISKPMKQLVENQNKLRRPIESSVDKSLRTLTEKRAEEFKAKKTAYDCAKTHERAEEIKQSKIKTEKDQNKTEKKQKQAFDALRKADKHYYDCCEKAEVARQEWDFTVHKANGQLQTLEEERLNKMNDHLNQYNCHISVLGPRLTQCCDKLNEMVISVDLSGDIKHISSQRGSLSYTPEQILIDSYAEDKQFTMKAERRKIALQNYILQIGQAIEREKKGREGVEKLVTVYQERPNFADRDAQDDAKQRLYQVIFMTNFLELSHFKIASFLAELDGSTKPTHKFSRYIEKSRDKQGMNMSVLKLPKPLAEEGHTGYDVDGVAIEALASDEPFDDDDFDEPTKIIGRCRALFDYQKGQPDDLELHLGNIINIYEKQPDGWWQGELNGCIGMFPASYVEEI
ncbi:hypothetical protein ACF0H5_018947 [Mactra antiquata]